MPNVTQPSEIPDAFLQEKAVYTAPQLADFLGVSRRVIFKWIRAGKIETDALYGRRLIRASTLLRLVQSGMKRRKMDTPPANRLR